MITFKDWILSNYPENSKISGQWGPLHIVTLLICISVIVLIALLIGKKSNNEKSKRIVLYILAGLILIFEISRRCINIYKNGLPNLHTTLHTLLPRPWCAISCWSIIIAVIFNKKYLYNVSSITSLLCAIIFFAYPGVGFNDRYILFENLYSIATHSLLLVTSITMITLKFTNFEYKTIWKELICLAVIFLYATFEIIIGIESDPMYFMPGGDIQQDILGIPYPIYLILYSIFIMVYMNLFYIINDRKNVFKKKN